MSSKSRYQNYGYPTSSPQTCSIASSSCKVETEKRFHCNQSSTLALPPTAKTNGLPHCTNELPNSYEHPSYSNRLEDIVHSMAYIRGELVCILTK